MYFALENMVWTITKKKTISKLKYDNENHKGECKSLVILMLLKNLLWKEKNQMYAYLWKGYKKSFY